MYRLKSSRTGRIKLFTLSVLCIAVSLLLGMAVYIFVAWITYTRPADAKTLFHIFAAAALVLITAAALLSTALLKRIKKEGSYVDELVNFKDYIDALHFVSTEVEVYEILYDYISKMPLINSITVLYSSSQEDASWKTLSNRDFSLCDFKLDKCPILCHHKDCMVKNIEKCDHCPFHAGEYKNGSYMCLPIIDTAHHPSIIQLYSTRENHFNSQVMSKIKSYIEIARPVINSKRTIHALNRKAATDKLTKLYNRSYLDTYLDHQIENAGQSNQQVSIIMIDIDYFKTINDTYGHMTGDYILTYFAGILLQCIRKSDLVARYGGDEFMVVLPTADVKTAQAIAERIKNTLSGVQIPPFDGIEFSTLSCSLGISTYPDCCTNKEDLIKTSDNALYKAKKSGRDCIRVYGGTINEHGIKA